MSNSEPKSQKTETQINKTFSLEAVCRSSNILKNIEDIVLTHPHQSARQLGMSIVSLLYSDYDKVLDYLENLCAENPQIPQIYRRIAEIHIAQEDYEKAVPYLQKTLELDYRDLTAEVWLCLLYYKINNKKNAASYFKSLQEEIFRLRVTRNSRLE